MPKAAENNMATGHSPITATVAQLFTGLKYLSVMEWIRHWFPIYRHRSDLSQQEVGSTDYCAKRLIAIEIYIAAWIFVEAILAILSVFGPWAGWLKVLSLMFCSSRIIEIGQVTANAAIFDAMNGRGDNMVGNRIRMVVLAAINFIELATCFGIIYANYFVYLHGAGRPITAFYFSITTQMTIGFGDVYPTGCLRLIVAVHALITFMFVVLVLGRFIASLPPINELFQSGVRNDHASISSSDIGGHKCSQESRD